ncbi:MAG: Hpt domain-containing protein [Bacteroidales bacterium]|nr:Hpt domain-containing protein [Bacteroidales bacterium]
MIDLTYLRTTTDNDKAVIQELIQIFVTQLPEIKRSIVSAYEHENWHELKELAHKAKNSFEIMGLRNQADELKRIEKIAQKDKPDPELKVLISSFLKTCEIVLDEIKNLNI